MTWTGDAYNPDEEEELMRYERRYGTPPDDYEETDHPEIVEFEGKTLGDTLTNLLAEVKRLRKKLAHYQDNCTIVWMRDDVLALDDTLTYDQVSWVLERMEHKHDASIGVSWDTIEFWISEVKKND